MENTYNTIKENVERIRYEIGDTCAKIGRNADDVVLMGVSKTKTAQDVEAAIKAGITLNLFVKSAPNFVLFNLSVINSLQV